MPKPVADARSASAPEYRFLSDVPSLAAGVLRPRSVSPDAHPSGVACEIDVQVGHVPSPRSVVSTVHHEMVHCGLRDLLGPHGRDNFLAHVAEHVPVSDLVGTWYASSFDRSSLDGFAAGGVFRALGAESPPPDGAKRAEAGVARSQTYASLLGADPTEWTASDGSRAGYLDLSSPIADPSPRASTPLSFEGSVDERIRMWIEESFTALSTSVPVASGPASLPSAPPSDAGSMTEWARAMARDLLAVYSGDLSAEALRSRYAPLVDSCPERLSARAGPEADASRACAVREHASPPAALGLSGSSPDTYPSLLPEAPDRLALERELADVRSQSAAVRHTLDRSDPLPAALPSEVSEPSGPAGPGLAPVSPAVSSINALARSFRPPPPSSVSRAPARARGVGLER